MPTTMKCDAPKQMMKSAELGTLNRALLAAASPGKMVAILALQGLAKMDIADALSVCPRRVEQILNKLAGIASGLGADDGMSSDLFQGGM